MTFDVGAPGGASIVKEGLNEGPGKSPEATFVDETCQASGKQP